MSEDITIVIRIMPNAEDVEVSLPPTTTSRELKDHLLQAELSIPQSDGEENPIVYQLLVKGKNEVIPDQDSLQEALVADGDLLLMIPKVIAGKQ